MTGCYSSRPLQTPVWELGTHSCLLISFHTTPTLGFVFHSRKIIKDYGFFISVAWSLECTSFYVLCHGTNVMYVRILHEFCFALCSSVFLFIQPFVTPQFPDLSCEPQWPSWCTDLSLWICCMCEYGWEFEVLAYCTFAFMVCFAFFKHFV